ncbi:polyprotein [Morchella importuna endornavirus 2]|nr:polyprotein [Morchella importuna endornavirus 2]
MMEIWLQHIKDQELTEGNFETIPVADLLEMLKKVFGRMKRKDYRAKKKQFLLTETGKWQHHLEWTSNTKDEYAFNLIELADELEASAEDWEEAHPPPPPPPPPKEKVMREEYTGPTQVGGSSDCWSALPLMWQGEPWHLGGHVPPMRDQTLTIDEVLEALEASKQANITFCWPTDEPRYTIDFAALYTKKKAYKFTRSRKLVHIEPCVEFDGKVSLEFIHKTLKVLKNLEEKENADKPAETPEKFVIGLDPGFFLANSFVEGLRLATGDDGSAQYREAVNNHDDRVVNNTFARIELQLVKTVKPSSNLLSGNYSSMERTSFVTSEQTEQSADKEFLLDVCATYAYNNVDHDVTTYDDATAERLDRQTWFERKTMDIQPTTAQSTYYVAIEPEFNRAMITDFTVIIGPELGPDNSGKFGGALGWYQTVEGLTYYSFNTESKGTQVGWWHEFLRGNNHSTIRGVPFDCVARKSFYGMQVVIITNLKYNLLTVMESNEHFFDIPVVDTTFLSNFGLPKIIVRRMRLNKDLLNRLMTKNLTGKVGKDSLTEYGMALSWYSYNKRGVELANYKITPEDVKTHVYVAMVLQARESFYDAIYEQLLNPGLPKVLFAAFSSTATVAMDMLGDTTKTIDFMTKIEDYIKLPNVRSMIGHSMENWMSIDVWSQSSSIIGVKLNDYSICAHHTMCLEAITDYRCTCCRAQTAPIENSRCICCAYNPNPCYHELNDEHKDPESSNKCKCCNRSSSASLCIDCRGNTAEYITLETTAAASTKLGVTKHHRAKKEVVKTSTKPDGETDKPTDQLKTTHTPHDDWITQQGYTWHDKFKKFVHEVDDTNACIDLNDTGNHQHRCWKCNTVYEHSHAHKSTLHPQFFGDCPTCPKRPPPEKREERKPTTISYTHAQLAQSIPSNALAILTGRIKLNELAHVDDAHPLLSAIPFICVGTPTIPKTMFTISDVQDVTISDCGLDCVKTYIGIDFSEVRAMKTIRKLRGLGASDIQKLLKDYSINSCIVDAAGAHFSRSNASENFAVIVHGTAIDNDNDKSHWQICKLRWKEDAKVEYFCDPLSTPQKHHTEAANVYKCKYSELSNDEKLALAFMMIDKHTVAITSDLETPKVHNGYLYNSETHEMRNGQYNFKLKEKHAEMATAMVECFETGVMPEILTGAWDIDLSSILDVQTHVDMAIRDELHKICSFLAEPTLHGTITSKYLTTDLKGKSKLDLTDTKLKNGDLIMIREGTSFKPKVLSLKSGMVDVKSNDKTGFASIDIVVPKASFMSSIIKLFALTRCNTTESDLINSYKHKSTRITVGAGGTGKSTNVSTEIKKWLEKQDKFTKPLVIACTSGGVDSLRKKLPKSIMVYSRERASYIELPDHDVVIFDECTTILPWELGLIVSAGKPMWLLGDPTQISVIDFSSGGGGKVMLNAIQAGERYQKVKKLTSTYRYGKTLVGMLSQHPAMADLESVAPHDTTVNLKWLEKWNTDDILDLIGDAQVILCFYNAHVKTLTKAMQKARKSIRTITTVHTYQGLDADKVAVVQAPLSATADTHLSFGHCVSAATRCRTSLVWITINDYSPSTSLAGRLGTFIGAGRMSTGEVYTNTSKVPLLMRKIEANNRLRDIPDGEPYVIDSVRPFMAFVPRGWRACALISPTEQQLGSYILSTDVRQIQLWFEYEWGCCTWSATPISSDPMHLQFSTAWNSNQLIATQKNRLDLPLLTVGDADELVRLSQNENWSLNVNGIANNFFVERLCLAGLLQPHMVVIRAGKLCSGSAQSYEYAPIYEERSVEIDTNDEILTPSLEKRQPELYNSVTSASMSSKNFVFGVGKYFEILSSGGKNEASKPPSNNDLAEAINIVTQTTEAGTTTVDHETAEIVNKINMELPDPDTNLTDFNPGLFMRTLQCFPGTSVVTVTTEQNENGAVEGINLKVIGLNARINFNLETNELEFTNVPTKYVKSLTTLIRHCSTGVDVENCGPAMTNLLEIGWWRIRIIAYVAKVYHANKMALVLTGRLEGWTVETIGTCCAACAGVKFTNGNHIVVVTKDYMTAAARTVVGEQCMTIADALNQVPTWDYLDPELDNKAYSHAILTERISTALKDIPHGLTGFQNWMWYNKSDNVLLRTEIKQTLNKDIEITNYDDMSLYPFFGTNATALNVWNAMNTKLGATSLLATVPVSCHTGGKRQVIQVLPPINLQGYINVALNHLYDMFRDDATARLIAKKYMGKIGAKEIERLPGMAESIAWHKARNTATYRNIVSRLSKQEIKALKDERKIAFVPTECKIVLDKYEMGASIACNNRNTVCDGASSAFDVYTCGLVSHKNKQIQLMGSTIYAAYTIQDKQVKSWYHPTDDWSMLQFRLDTPLYRDMIKLHNSRLGFEDPEYQLNDAELRGGKVWTGMHDDFTTVTVVSNPYMLSYSGSELEEKYNSCARIIMWAPREVHEQSGIRFVRVPNSQKIFTVHKDQAQAIDSGKMVKGTSLKWHVLSSHGPIVIYELTNDPVWFEPAYYSQRTIIIDTPTFLIDPTEILKQRSFVKTKAIAYNLDMVSNLRRRLLRPGTDWDDLLVQARTLVNVAQFGTHTVSARYRTNVAEAKMACRLAWMTHQMEETQFSLLGMDGDNLVRPKEMAALALGKLTEKLFPDVDETDLAKAINEFLQIDKAKCLIYNFFNCLNKLKLKIDEGKRRVLSGDDVPWQPTDRNFWSNKPSAFEKVAFNETDDDITIYVHCPHCANPSHRAAAEVLSEGKINFSTHQKAIGQYLITSECTHNQRDGIKIQWHGYSSGKLDGKTVLWSSEHRRINTTVKIAVEDNHLIIEDEVLNLPADLNVIGINSYPIISNCIVNVESITAEVELLLGNCYSCSITYPCKLDAGFDFGKRANNVQFYKEGDRTVRIIDEAIADASDDEEMVAITKKIDTTESLFPEVDVANFLELSKNFTYEETSGAGMRCGANAYAQCFNLDPDDVNVMLETITHEEGNFEVTALLQLAEIEERALAIYVRGEGVAFTTRCEISESMKVIIHNVNHYSSVNLCGSHDIPTALIFTNGEKIDRNAMKVPCHHDEQTVTHDNLRLIDTLLEDAKLESITKRKRTRVEQPRESYEPDTKIKTEKQPFKRTVQERTRETRQQKPVGDPEYEFFNKMMKIDDGARPTLSNALIQALKDNKNDRVPIYTNPGVGLVNKRFSLGRNMLHTDSTHFVDRVYRNGARVTNWMALWLSEFEARIATLNPKPDDIWYVYSLRDGFATRSPSVGKGRHINIGQHSEKMRSLGYETLELDEEPGRFGACLRVIFAMLLPCYKKVYFRSGRPGLHVLWAEHMQTRIECTENHVIIPTNTFGPFIDGICITKPLSVTSIAKFLASNMNYHAIYGIDECDYSWFEIKVCYFAPESKYAYSNYNLNPRYAEIVKEITMIPVDTANKENNLKDIPFEMIQLSFTSIATTWPVALYLDPELPLVSREGAKPKDSKLVTEWLACRNNIDGTPSGEEWKTGSLLPRMVINNNYTPKSPLIQHVKMGKTNVLFSSDTNKYCVRNALYYCLHRRAAIKSHEFTYNINLIQNICKFKPFQTQAETISMWTMLGLNVCLTGGQPELAVTVNDGPVDYLSIRVDIMGNQHMTVVEEGDVDVGGEYSATEVRLEGELITTGEMNHQISEFWILSEYLMTSVDLHKYEYITRNQDLNERLVNARQRMRGRYDVTVANTGGAHWKDHVVKATIGEQSDRQFFINNSLVPGRTYMFRAAHGMVARVAGKLGNNVLIPSGDFIPNVYIDIAASVDKKKPTKLPKRTLRSGAKMGFFKASEKHWAIANYPTWANYPVMDEPDVLLLVDFDNMDHHGRPYRTRMLDIPPGNIRIPNEIDIEEITLLRLGGPLRLGVKAGEWYVSTVVESRWTEEDLVKVVKKLDRQYSPTKIVKMWSAVKWEHATWRDEQGKETVGNRLQPLKQKLTINLLHIRNEPLTDESLRIINNNAFEGIDVTGDELTRAIITWFPNLDCEPIVKEGKYRVRILPFNGVLGETVLSGKELHDPHSFTTVTFELIGFGRDKPDKFITVKASSSSPVESLDEMKERNHLGIKEYCLQPTLAQHLVIVGEFGLNPNETKKSEIVKSLCKYSGVDEEAFYGLTSRWAINPPQGWRKAAIVADSRDTQHILTNHPHIGLAFEYGWGTWTINKGFSFEGKPITKNRTSYTTISSRKIEDYHLGFIDVTKFIKGTADSVLSIVNALNGTRHFEQFKAHCQVSMRPTYTCWHIWKIVHSVCKIENDTMCFSATEGGFDHSHEIGDNSQWEQSLNDLESRAETTCVLRSRQVRSMVYFVDPEYDEEWINDDLPVRITIKPRVSDLVRENFDWVSRSYGSITTLDGWTLEFSPVGFGRDNNSTDVDNQIRIDDIKTKGVAKYQYWAKEIEVTMKNEMPDIVLNMTKEQESAIRTTNVINELTYVDWDKEIVETKYNAGNVFVVGNGTMTSPTNDDVVEEMVPPSVINYWDDETAMIDGVINLPKRNIKMKVNPEFTGLKEVSKATMTKYPTHALPGYNVRMNAGAQAVAELFGTHLSLRTVEHDPETDARQFMSIYTHHGAVAALEQVNIEPDEIIEWLKERPDNLKITKEVDQILADGLDITGLDKVNVHMKLESRLKDVLCADHKDANGMPLTIEEQRIRLIVWQKKGITALFAPVFKKVKENLKRCMKQNVVYTDGMTPMQISALLNNIQATGVTFAEDDCKKQDRQTDKTLIRTEMQIYKKLGANPSVITMWATVHDHWRAKGIGIKFVGDASRHTGQATTAIGNAIVNLLVHMRFVKKMDTNMKMMLILGDDNIMVTTGAITEKDISLNSARHFNMVSEPFVHERYGTFLRNMVYKNSNNQIELGPDFVRLRRKFEVLNGVSEANDENIMMRSMSYAIMMGAIPRLLSVVESKGWPIKLEMWYEYHSVIKATAEKYGTTEAHIESHVNKLINMIRDQTLITRTKLMFTEKGH